VSGKAARRLADLRLNASTALGALVARGVIRRAGAERYFLDETLWAARRRMSGRTLARVGTAFLLALAAALVYWIGR
jgi:hypothetical protein